LLGKCEFHENQRSDIRTVLKGGKLISVHTFCFSWLILVEFAIDDVCVCNTIEQW